MQVFSKRMASACHRAMFLLVLVAGLRDAAADYNILDLEMARKHELHTLEHGRVYKDEAKKAQRFKKNIKHTKSSTLFTQVDSRSKSNIEKRIWETKIFD